MAPLSEVAGRYESRAELGRGTMGVVYRAYDRDLGRDVALKVIRSTVEGADAQSYERRFLNEARAAARPPPPAGPGRPRGRAPPPRVPRPGAGGPDAQSAGRRSHKGAGPAARLSHP